MKYILTLVLLLGTARFTYSQSEQRSSSEILQAFSKLRTTASVLYIAAHPDDENTRLLTYLSKERNMRTAYLSLTRGDGGQNLIGKEQAEYLGLIRTNELLQARKVDGGEQYFTRANDFGYSKTPEETFKFWNKDSILSDVVWVIRNFKPDVIICRFPTTGEGGHGHHTASAILAIEAFDAAADPKKFSDQLKHTSTWQAKRIFWNTFNFGGTNTTSPEQIKIDVGGFNPLLGKSYGEIAAESRSMHKSQGFGSAKTRGTQLEYFKILKGDSVKTDIFEKIDPSWNRFPKTEEIRNTIDELINSYDPFLPSGSTARLLKLRSLLKTTNSSDPNLKGWIAQKLKETEKLLQDVSGIYIEATNNSYSVIAGDKLELSLTAINRGQSAFRIQRIIWPSKSDTVLTKDLLTNIPLTVKHREQLAKDIQPNGPYWLEEPLEAPGRFKVRRKELLGLPETPTTIEVIAECYFENERFDIKVPVVYKSTDPVKGEQYRRLEVIPAATVQLSEKLLIFTAKESKKFQLTIRSYTDSIQGIVKINAPSGWKIDQNIPFDVKGKNNESTIQINIEPEENAIDGKLSIMLESNHGKFNRSLERITHEHIPPQFLLTPAEIKIQTMALEKKDINIGYIPGAGDDVPAALRQAGYAVTILTDEMIASMDLSPFSAIITGVRAYNTNEKLQILYPKLMIYVENGGNLLVQYNTNNRIGPLNAKIFPYSFTITRDRVTDEQSPVSFIDDSDPVLKFPNKITQEDFKNWIQERGIYFAGESDKKFRQVLMLNDPGEKPTSGSIIIAPHGKGNLIYTGLAFFRQLPAGVEGAFRLFANLIATPGTK